MGKTKATKKQGRAFTASQRFVASPMAQGFAKALADAIKAFQGEKALVAAATELQEKLGNIGAAHFTMGLAALAAQVGPQRAIALVRTFVNGATRVLNV
jgi:hypothetical protein